MAYDGEEERTDDQQEDPNAPPMPQPPRVNAPRTPGFVPTTFPAAQPGPDLENQNRTPQAPAPQAPAGAYNRDKFRDEWMSGNYGHTPADLQSFVSGHPEFAYGVQVGGSKGDRITTPTGEVLDAVIGAGRGGTGNGWTGILGEGGVSLGGGGGSSLVAAGSNTPDTPMMPTPVEPPTPGGDGKGEKMAMNPDLMGPMAINPYTGQAEHMPKEGFTDPKKAEQDKAIEDAINRLLARGEKKVTGEDVQDQYQPVSRAIDLGSQRTRQAAAERAAFSGNLNSGQGGGFDAEVNGIMEDAGTAKGQEMAKLMQTEIQARRDDVVNALQFAQGEQKMKLTMQLAQMDDQLRRLQLSQQESQFGRSLAQDESQFGRSQAQQEDQFGRSLNQNNDQFGRNLDQNNRHFYDDMGYRIGSDEAQYNYLYDKMLNGI